jgi:hypothetical protein
MEQCKYFKDCIFREGKECGLFEYMNCSKYEPIELETNQE